jgi:RHS repeat-associated protein
LSIVECVPRSGAGRAKLRIPTYTNTLQNTYSSRTVPGYIDVFGTANTNATVTVNAQATDRREEYFRYEVAANNSSSSLYPDIVTTATLGLVRTYTNRVFVPATPQQFFYDADGNLLSDGHFTNQWDNENRLVQSLSLASTPAASRRKLNYEYDFSGRRIRKKVFYWDTALNNYPSTPAVDIKFVYDGWNLLAELDAANNAVLFSYLWGLDFSGSLQGAGGVGGLAAVKAADGSAHFPAYDLNGNVIGLIDAETGYTSATYEYGPFGEPLRATGYFARENPFRFSSKYYDEETGLSYYGYRYYSASVGRWLSKDPIEENGGLNLYAFANNNALIHIDPDGRAVLSPALIAVASGPSTAATTVTAATTTTVSLGGSGTVITIVGNVGATVTVATTAKITIGSILGWGLPTAAAGGALGYGIGHYSGFHDWFGNQLAGPSPSSEALPLPAHVLGAIATEDQWIDAEGNIRDEVSNQIIRDKYGRRALCPPTRRPQGFSNGNFGNAVHAKFLDALVALTGTRQADWLMQTAPGQNGVDATYIGPEETDPGFTYAELKPYTPYSMPRFFEQLDRWNLPPGKTQLFYYNPQGVIGSSGFNF